MTAECALNLDLLVAFHWCLAALSFTEFDTCDRLFCGTVKTEVSFTLEIDRSRAAKLVANSHGKKKI